MSDHSSGMAYVILGAVVACVLIGAVLGGGAVSLTGLGCG